MKRRALLLVLDSFGIGASADADRFGDVGANTLLHIAQACARGDADSSLRSGELKLPNLARLGLGHAAAASGGVFPPGFAASVPVQGAYGYAREISTGKDTPSGHWEMAGVPVLFDWGYFPEPQNSFPQSLLDDLIRLGACRGFSETATPREPPSSSSWGNSTFAAANRSATPLPTACCKLPPMKNTSAWSGCWLYAKSPVGCATPTT